MQIFIRIITKLVSTSLCKKNRWLVLERIRVVNLVFNNNNNDDDNDNGDTDDDPAAAADDDN